jgi:hypothetical protein
LADSLRHGIYVGHGNQNASSAVFDDLGNAAAIGCDYGLASRHAFNNDLAEGFTDGRGMHQKVEFGNGSLNVVAEPGKFHTMLDPKLAGQPPDFLIVPGFAE